MADKNSPKSTRLPGFLDPSQLDKKPTKDPGIIWVACQECNGTGGYLGSCRICDGDGEVMQ